MLQEVQHVFHFFEVSISKPDIKYNSEEEQDLERLLNSLMPKNLLRKHSSDPTTGQTQKK